MDQTPLMPTTVLSLLSIISSRITPSFSKIFINVQLSASLLQCRYLSSKMNKRDGLSTKDIFFGRNGKAPRRNVDLGSSSLR